MAESAPRPCLSCLGRRRLVPWRITLHYRLAKPGPQDVSINLVDSNTGKKSQPVAFPSLSSGKQRGTEYEQSVCARISQRITAPEIVIVTTTADVLFSLFVVAVTIKTPLTTFKIPCFSWVTESQGERVFLGGVPALPKHVPSGKSNLQDAELEGIRAADGKTRSATERIYDYAVYNDLGEPDGALKRAPLGGSKEKPFPRRLRTGRPLASDGESEVRTVDSGTGRFWIPEDEAFAPEKRSGVYSRAMASQARARAAIQHFGGPTSRFEDIDSLSGMYEDTASDSKFPLPAVYKDRPDAWKTDQDFGRQRIAGTNPLTIEAIDSLPKGSAISSASVDESLLEGGNLVDRLKEGRMFIVDYSIILPLVEQINAQPGPTPRFQYAPRCLLYSRNDGGLVPVAIELMLPSESGTVNEVYTPKNSMTEWTLAKANLASLDFAVHEGYSHFTRCHGSTEPYLIATRRNLPSSHPLYRLLLPHFKDTLSINAGARSTLISGGGNVESITTIGSFTHDVMCTLYSNLWRFKTEGLPGDLIKRKMATPRKGGNWQAGEVDLVLKDYPYAEDGLLVWRALYNWVSSYLSLYYKGDSDIVGDVQLAAWWEEIKTKGHPDLVAFGIAEEEDVWPALETVSDLAYILVTIMWVASGQHAAVNFGQYDYHGYMPNHPSCITHPMPKTDAIKTDPNVLDEQTFLNTVSPLLAAIKTTSLVQTLSYHGEGEEFLGDEIPHWLVDPRATKALQGFRKEILEVEKKILERNRDASNPARALPYTFLIPNLPSGAGVPSSTGRGIPNSISI